MADGKIKRGYAQYEAIRAVQVGPLALTRGCAPRQAFRGITFTVSPVLVKERGSMSKAGKLLGHAQPHLEQGERIEAHVQGVYETKLMGSNTVRAGIFLATDRRLVFYAKKLGGYDFESFPYANISSFEQAKGMMGHSFRFFASGNTVSMKWINDGAAFGEFARLVTERTGNKPRGVPHSSLSSPEPQSSEDDVFEALSRLGKLRDAGVVTPEEFEAKKAELLARI